MCHFWQAGAETIENIMFGERAMEKKIGGAQGRVLPGQGAPGRL